MTSYTLGVERDTVDTVTGTAMVAFAVRLRSTTVNANNSSKWNLIVHKTSEVCNKRYFNLPSGKEVTKKNSKKVYLRS